MANEAVCIETPTKFGRRTCAAGTDLPYGSILQLTDPNTGSLTSADGQTFGGIVWVEKDGDNASTEVTVALNGVWDLTDSGSGVSVGGIVSVGGANTVKQATEAEMVTGDVIGKAEETASASEVIRVRVGAQE